MVVVDAQFGVDGPAGEPERRRCLPGPVLAAAIGTARTGPGSREGATSMVSSKVGPSGVAGLSKMAVTVRLPSASRPSMLSSGPGRYSSTSRGSRAGRRAAARTRRIRAAAVTAAAGPSARRMPWLALSDIALTTHGNPTVSAARRMASAGAVAGTISNLGCGTPAAAQRCRCLALSAAFRTASAGLCGSPISPATVADSGSMGVSAATTALTIPARSTTRRALASGSAGCTGMTWRPPSGSAPSLPTTRSRPMRAAASRKSVAR